MNLAMLLEMAAQADPAVVAVSGEDTELTRGDLLERATSVAEEIRRSGVTAVAYLGINTPEAVALMFGCSVAGVSYVPVNYRWTDDQINAALGRITPVAVVTDAACAARVRETPGVVGIGQPGGAAPRAVAAEEAPAVLLFTSGTSGPPKVAVLRNQNLVSYVLGTVEFLSAGPDEAILVAVPPYHIAAVSSVLTSVYAGRRMVQLPAFTPEAWVDVARRERVTQAMVVPTMLSRILDIIEEAGEGLPALRHVSYGGGRMPAAVVARAMALLPHVDLVNAYGLTETSSTIALLDPDDHRAAASADPRLRARLGSVGRPVPTVEIQVRDDCGAVLPAGEAGEIWVRGDQVSGEYLSHTATDPDGWYPTRDHGFLDEDGYLFVQGRADDIIVRGGENLSPTEIEDRLLEHPTVAEAAVVGAPDQEWGERVEAFVVPAAGATVDQDVVRDWVRQALRSAKVPAVIHVRDALPYNETGKLLRRDLRAELADAAETVPRAVRCSGPPTSRGRTDPGWR